jgi:diguanylate cyclase (GGDEF)-like protein
MQTQLPWRLCADVANVVARADTVVSACEAIVDALFGTLLIESAIFSVNGSVRTRLAARLDKERAQLWQAQLAELPTAATLGIVPGQDGPATYVAIMAAHERMVLVIDGDVTDSAQQLLACAAVISAGLDALRWKEQRRRQVDLIRRGYRLLRLLSRAHGADGVAHAIVGSVSEFFDAERTSLARYDKDDDRLRIAATKGVPADLMTSVAVRPGEWVIGHVHESERPLIVNDPSDLPVPRHHGLRYRPGPFAVVPLTHQRSGVGVLSLTDRRNGGAFQSEERQLLRMLAPVLGAFITAGRQEDEAVSLRYAATVDSLTGLHNRGYLDRRLHEEIGRSRREGSRLSVLMADIDDFKGLNDARGHAMGDAVLKHIGELIRSAVRVFDVCARYGGDEFVIVMPNSDPANAHACAERIRAKTARSLQDAGLPAVSLSVGVAAACLDTPAELLDRADRALYAAKASGKNVVRVDGASPAAENVDTAHSLIGTPLRRDGDVIGAVCAVDDGPLTLAEGSLTRFEDLGVSGPPVGGTAPSRARSVPAEPAPLPSGALQTEQAGLDPADVETGEVEWQPTLLERRPGEFEVARELARARRERRQMSVVLFDVTRCPDSGGDRDALEEPLRSVADTLLRVIRPSDLPIRWSANELLLVLPGLANADARAVAERVRAAMQAGERHRVSISGGVAELQLDEPFRTVVNRARERVLVALDHGRNRVS